MTTTTPISTAPSVQAENPQQVAPYGKDLTAEERAELTAENPQLLAEIDSTEGHFSRLNKIHLWRVSKLPSVENEEATRQAATIQEEVAKLQTNVEQTTLAHWCGYPTDLTRCSPFFPLNQRVLGERKYMNKYLITAANWGKIEYSGPQLTTFEEDSLLAVLALLNGQSPEREVSYVLTQADADGKPVSDVVSQEGYSALLASDPGQAPRRKTYTYRGPILPLLRLLGYKQPGKREYARLINSLELLKAANVKISITGGKTKSGRQRPPRKTQMVDMLSAVMWDDEKKELCVTINPFFYETYLAGRITMMDVTRRLGLKGILAKALYRFVTSQRGNPAFAGHFLTLADALNMDREQPAYITRHQIKTAINELIRHNVLTKKSGFVDQDIVKLARSVGASTNKSGKS